MLQRRNMKLDELALAIYLRGKSGRFGNPYPQADKYTCKELNISKKILRKLRRKLQEKGVIKYDTSLGRGKATVYTMLDTIMAEPALNREIKGAQSRIKGTQKGTFNHSVKGARMGTPRSKDEITKEKEWYRIYDKNHSIA
jgi:hypothetical protein